MTVDRTKWWQRVPKDFWYLLGLLIITRLVLTLIGVGIRQHWFGFTNDWALPGLLSSHVWLNVWGLWDTGWYYRLATEWYSAAQPLGFAFFPLYPGIVRLFGELVGHHFPIGVVVANAALLAAAWLLWKLPASRVEGWRAVAALLAFPAAFVLSGMFTESLYLALALGVFMAMKMRRWWMVGLLGLALSFTRPVGFLIVIPAALEFMQQAGWSLKNIGRQVVWILIIPLGLPVWAWYNHLITGDWLNFVHVQAVWRRGATDPVSALITGLRADNFYDQALAGSAIVVAVLLILLRKKLSLSESVWAWLSLTVPLFSGIYSLPRYILVIFPLYLGFARLNLPRPLRWTIILLMMVVQLGLFVYWPKLNSWVV